MNERIQRLLEQSGLQPYYDAQEGQIEKFAELIVQECIAMADDFECDVNQRGLVDRMKQHFGVEE